MNFLKRAFQILIVVVSGLQLTACSKTVQWEEEVPLNTGETIWVKRMDSYERRSQPGNPLKMGWRIDKRAYEFTWRGRNYSYRTGGLRESLGAILIYAFADEDSIAIIDTTRKCAQPGYAEFRWRNAHWRPQKNVNPILIGQPRNLMFYYSARDGEIPKRVTKEIRYAEDTKTNRGKTTLTLEKTKLATNCSRSK